MAATVEKASTYVFAERLIRMAEDTPGNEPSARLLIRRISFQQPPFTWNVPLDTVDHSLK